MKIALDFDGTFTADPHLWSLFIFNARNAGHEVRIVTMRCRIKDGINWSAVWSDMPTRLHDAPCEVIWCDGHAKREWCRSIGWEPDIWIDDDPYSLVHGSKWAHESPELIAWRVTDKYKNPPPGATNGQPKANRKPALQRRRPAE